MDEPALEDEPCEQCGLCCRILGPGIAPTVPNVYVWMEQGRTDILRWYVAFMEKGDPIKCIDLRADDLGDVVSFEMRHPETGEFVTVCPFLRRVAKTRYLCGIHFVKPDMCWNYQPWVWGETYFNRCLALKKIDRKCRWPHE
ncbi:YkgJ family cysteine cluster protein [Methanoregula sp.]|uniref:YkgJ family cysteine cluster protein n=1 Tax=Methanoregula sp. TaxID=2052170 RepID=UPI003564619F